MRHISFIFFIFVAFVAAVNADSPKWSDLHSIVGATDTAPEFMNFVSQYGLTKRPMEQFDSRPVPPFFFANDSGVAVFLDFKGRIDSVHLTPMAGFDASACFPLPKETIPTKASILACLGLSDSPAEDRGNGIQGYRNPVLGVGVMFLKEQLQFTYFYPPKQ
jgi:hypothetical protein